MSDGTSRKVLLKRIAAGYAVFLVVMLALSLIVNLGVYGMTPGDILSDLEYIPSVALMVLLPWVASYIATTKISEVSA